MDKKLIIIILLIGIISFGIGASWGINKTHEWYLNLAWALMDRDKINITIDKYMIKTGIWQFKNQVGGCLFLEDNAFISNDTGNEVA